jgi:GrpB-like predicted nucleotidyltransferase (UPF0157 family)
MSELTSSKVILVTANPDWEKEFLVERKRIRSISSLDLVIEHIGSTSIPNMSAKPTIDMLVGVSTETELDDVFNNLIKFGYVLEGRRNSDTHSWLSFPTPEKRKYIIHLVIKGDEEWTKRINFRDYLISHPEVAEQYNTLKLQLAMKYPNNLEEYTKGKAAFVSDIVATAGVKYS